MRSQPRLTLLPLLHHHLVITQRIALARALYGRPSLLLLDDPLSAVDTKTSVHLLESLLAYVHAQGTCRAALIAMNQSHLLPKFDLVLQVRVGQAVIMARCFSRVEPVLVPCPRCT